MTIDNIIALAIGACFGFGIVQGMFWLVKKAMSQSRSCSSTITRTSDGSIYINAGTDNVHITGNIRAGDGGTKRRGGHQGPSDSDRKQFNVEEPKPDLATTLKTNMLD